MTRKILSHEQAVSLVTSGKRSDMKKFLKKFVREIREQLVVDSQGAYESVQHIIDDACEDSTENGCLSNNDDETHFGLRVCSVECSPQHDGEAFEEVFRVQLAENFNEILAYFRISGSYSSYDGIEWDDDVELVTPYQVQVTKYMTDKERKDTNERIVT